jgi:hypothetical protein
MTVRLLEDMSLSMAEREGKENGITGQQCKSHRDTHDDEHHTSNVTHHTSHVTRHTSHVTRHTSHVTRHTSRITSQIITRVSQACVASRLKIGIVSFIYEEKGGILRRVAVMYKNDMRFEVPCRNSNKKATKCHNRNNSRRCCCLHTGKKSTHLQHRPRNVDSKALPHAASHTCFCTQNQRWAVTAAVIKLTWSEVKPTPSSP